MITKNVNDTKVVNEQYDEKCEKFRSSFSIESMISKRNEAKYEPIGKEDTPREKWKNLDSPAKETIGRNGNKVRLYYDFYYKQA